MHVFELPVLAAFDRSKLRSALARLSMAVLLSCMLAACGPTAEETSSVAQGSGTTQSNSGGSADCQLPKVQGASAGHAVATRVLQELLEGNQRFVDDGAVGPNRTMLSVRATADGQSPKATIVSCSDSRVPAEIIFDQGIGDLFLVRTAGQVPTFASFGSIEFATKVLKTRLIVVLGHTRCGAVAAAVNGVTAGGHIDTLVQAILPAAEAVRHLEGDPVDNAVRENVRRQVRALQELEPILSQAYQQGEIDIVGAVYDIATGVVSILEP